MKSSLNVSAIDPELSVCARLLLWLFPAVPRLTRLRVTVRIAQNDRGGWSIYPESIHAHTLLCVHVEDSGETGNFATYADAAKRAAWNAWDISPVCTAPMVSREVRQGRNVSSSARSAPAA